MYVYAIFFSPTVCLPMMVFYLLFDIVLLQAWNYSQNMCTCRPS